MNTPVLPLTSDHACACGGPGACSMSAQRLVPVFCANVDVAEDLTTALDMARERPWAPLPPGANVATYQQERVSEEETDQLILTFLKRAARAGYSTPGGSLVIP